jgi:hypothetical protein
MLLHNNTETFFQGPLSNRNVSEQEFNSENLLLKKIQEQVQTFFQSRCNTLSRITLRDLRHFCLKQLSEVDKKIYHKLAKDFIYSLPSHSKSDGQVRQRDTAFLASLVNQQQLAVINKHIALLRAAVQSRLSIGAALVFWEKWFEEAADDFWIDT